MLARRVTFATAPALRFVLGATLVAVGAGALTMVSTGCGNQCDRNPDAPPVVYNGGTTRNGVYDSAPSWNGYLDFPPGRTYRFVHHLGGIPQNITPYVAFETNPVNLSNDGSPGSGTTSIVGNQFTINRVTATTFDVFNDTCSDIQLRVTASNAETGPTRDGGARASGARDAGPDAAR
jgi:hypothetical protein